MIRCIIFLVVLLASSLVYADDCRKSFSADKIILSTAQDSDKGISLNKLINDKIKNNLSIEDLEAKLGVKTDAMDRALIDILNYISLGKILVHKTDNEVTTDYYLEQFNIIMLMVVDIKNIHGMRMVLDYLEGLKLVLVQEGNSGGGGIGDILINKIAEMQQQISDNSIVEDNKLKRVIKQLVNDSIKSSGRSESYSDVQLNKENDKISETTMMDMIHYINTGTINIHKTEDRVIVEYYLKQIDEIESATSESSHLESLGMVLHYLEALRLTLEEKDNKNLSNTYFLVNNISKVQLQIFTKGLDQQLVNPFSQKKFFILIEYSPQSVVDRFVEKAMQLGRHSILSLVMRSPKMKEKSGTSQSIWNQRFRVWGQKIRKFLSGIFD